MLDIQRSQPFCGGNFRTSAHLDAGEGALVGTVNPLHPRSFQGRPYERVPQPSRVRSERVGILISVWVNESYCFFFDKYFFSIDATTA